MSMAAYLTTAGLDVLTRVMASHGSLDFVRADLGSGVVTGEAACRARTSLANKVAEATFVSSRYEGGEAKISIQYNNAGLTQGFFVNEIGLYVLDPLSSALVLYCYATFGDGTTPDWIAPASSADYTRTYDIMTIVSNVSSVTVTASPSAMVTTSDFNEAMDKVGTILNAIESEQSMVNRDLQDQADTMNEYARNNQTTLMEILACYDATIRDLRDRLETAEAQIAAINT